MRPVWLAGTVLAAAVLAAVPVAGADPEQVPLYTSEDLDRMFGPVPTGPSVPVDKTTPEDWRWVEQFIDRQYARVDADRRYDLERRAQNIAIGRPETADTGYGYPTAWGLGYPASTWWNRVWWSYSTSVHGGYRSQRSVPSAYARAMGEIPRPVGEMTRRGGRPGGRPHHAR
jgi:hypothetical protein